jgi:hypothetical protein
MTKPRTKTVNDFSRCLDPLDLDATLIAVIEMSQSSWLVAGIVPGVERQPLKKLAIDEHALLSLLNRWRAEAEKQGHRITRIAVAFEAGHDGFWLARWLAAQGVEAHVIHASSVAVTREHRRAKTDRLDTELLKRALGCNKQHRMRCAVVWRRQHREHRRDMHLYLRAAIGCAGPDPNYCSRSRAGRPAFSVGHGCVAQHGSVEVHDAARRLCSGNIQSAGAQRD